MSEYFSEVKQEISSERVLCHYDPKLPIVLQTDASPVGIGAVLSHITEDDSEKPIMFASRSLTATERNYSQIDKEALSIVWAVKKYYQYLFGRHFHLVTDHKPLVSIFAPNKSLPCLSATRMVHYALFLQAFSYTIRYRNTKDHRNADALSRLPLSTGKVDANAANILQVEVLPITASEIAKATKVDSKLFELYESLRTGTELPLLWKGKESEFSLQQGCIMYGHRVCIPQKYHNAILEELHVGHPGIVKMKALARSYCYWQGIDSSITSFVQNSAACVSTRNDPSRIKRHPWEWPNGPLQRIHVDFAGPFMGKMFLVVVDAFSKWVEVMPMKNITSNLTIEYLRVLFAHYGLPLTVVSDNGRSFSSYEFRQFLKMNRDINVKLQRYLMQYRITPHSLTGETPSFLFLKRCIRTRLDILKPNVREHVMQKQSSHCLTEEITCEFVEGEKVAVRNYAGPPKWKIGTVINRDGSLNYSVQVGNEIWKRHVDQLRKCGQSLEITESTLENCVPKISERTEEPEAISDSSEVEKPDNSIIASEPSSTQLPVPTPESSLEVPSSIPVPLRRSTRFRKAPKRLGL
ncbi:uncharacterized protein K02A2.6-like [Uloborus diversus]|uniref:uncharacterized protein K02A2.6-like n=1 Tax=Uloborus diversus TaxID=327109 RepID=UPI00240916A8|nr:uncharacterized protein K02A2.6-like [Uloborus diversus]